MHARVFVMPDSKELQQIPVLRPTRYDWYPVNNNPQTPEYWREVWGLDMEAAEEAAKSYGGGK